MQEILYRINVMLNEQIYKKDNGTCIIPNK